MADDVKIGIGAEDTGFGAALEEAKVQATEAAESIKASFESISATLENVQNAFLAFTAVLAGGEAFKEMISSTVDATVSSVALGRQLGISASDASQLKVAMASVFVTQDQVTGANQKITMALKKNESAFTDLGVATRDSNGNFRASFDIMTDVNEALMKFKEGTDRNVEGVKIYGRGWLEAQNTLRMTKEVIKETAAEADALGLTVGVEGKATTETYRKSMVELHEVMEAVGKVIADTLMPVLSSVGQWFGENGPEVVMAFRAALYSIDAAWIILKGGVNLFIDSLMGDFNIAIAQLMRFEAVAKAALVPGASVALAWKTETAKIALESKIMADNIKHDSEQMDKDLTAALDSHSGAFTKITAKDGGQKSDGGDEKKQRLMAELAAQLEAKKAAWATDQAAHGTFIQFSLEQEREFWESKTGVANAGSVDALTIQKNVDKLTVDIQKEAYTASLAAMKAQESNYKTNLQLKLGIAQEMAAKIATAEGANSSAAAKAGAEVLVIERQLVAQRLTLEEAYIKESDTLELSKVDAAQKAAELQHTLGVTTDAQLLAQEEAFENQRYQLKVAAMNRTLALLADDPDRNLPAIQANLNAQLQMQTQHDAAMQQLQAKAVVDANKDWKSMFSTMQSGFSSTIQGFLKGTTTLGGAIKGLFQDVANSIVGVLANMAAQYLATSLMSVLTNKTSAAAIITTLAGQAAAGAFAATAAIPYVGPELAPAAAALAYTDTMAFNVAAAASQGYDIPAGVNPIVQTHAQEMILPKEYADVIRGQANGGGGGGASFAINVSTFDGPSFQKYLNQNAGALAATFKKMNNRFMAPT